MSGMITSRTVMSRVILGAAAALLVAGAVQPASAGDGRGCANPAGDPGSAGCTRLFTVNPGNATVHNDSGYLRGRAQLRMADNAPTAPSSSGSSTDLRECRNLNNKDLAQRAEACTRAIASSNGNKDVALTLYRTRLAVYAQLGQFDLMVPDCEEVIRLAPDDPGSSFAYSLHGVGMYRQHEFARAIADLDKAITLDPSQVNFYYTRAGTYLKIGNYPKALADIDKMLSLKPDFVLGYSLKAQYHLELDDDAAALADVNEGLARDPQNGYCLVLRAEYYRRAASLTEAQADADRAVASVPKYDAAYTVRGRIALAQGRADAAVGDLTKAIELDDDKQPTAVAYRGSAYERAGNSELAAADYRHALELVAYGKTDRNAQAMARQRLAALTQARPRAPAATAQPGTTAQPGAAAADARECDNSANNDLAQRVEACTRAIASSGAGKDALLPLHRARMVLYGQLGQFDRVMPDCNEVIRFAPEDPASAPAYGLRGVALVKGQEFDRAVADLGKAIGFDPTRADFYLARAGAYLKMANFPQARADIDKAIGLKPDAAAGYFLRAQYHFELDDDDGALADTTEGLRRDPQNADCAALQAEYYLRAGKLTEAQADADRALEVNPRHAGAHAVRGRIALAQGRTETAVSELTQAIELDTDKQPGPVAYRGTAYERTGSTELATADYRHALELATYSKLDRDARAVARERFAALTQPQQSVPTGGVQPVQPAPPVQAAHPSTTARKCRNGLEVDCLFRSIGVLGQRACSQLFGSCPGPRH